MKNKTKKIIIIISAVLLTFIMINIVGGIIAYNIFFSRAKRKDYNITPGLINYEEVKDKYSRELYDIPCEDYKLQGYYYDNKNDNIVLISHGIKDSAESLLAQTMFFLDNDYSVFTYDSSGCGLSEGKMNGFSQSLIDLKYTLDFLNSQPKFSSCKYLLFGYSWGGYACTSILNFDYDNVIGSVSVAGYNDAQNLVFEKGKQYVGFLAYTGKGLVNVIQKVKFKDYLQYSAIQGINKSSKYVFIAQGKKDDVIRYNVDSIARLKDEITNPKVTYYINDNANHNTIMFCDEAIKYRQEVNEKLKKIKKYDDKVSYVKTVDDYAYSSLNKELFNAILNFYKKCIINSSK